MASPSHRSRRRPPFSPGATPSRPLSSGPAALIGEDEVQETTAFYTTYGGAYDTLGFETPLPGSARPSGETPVWVVTFKGMFYEPQGPRPDPTVTPRPRKPACSEVVVLIPDGVEPGSPDSWAEVTFLPADSCS